MSKLQSVTLQYQNKFLALKMLGFLAAILLAIPTAANATLIGADVDVTFYYPDQASFYCSNGSATVGSGVEYASSCSGFGPVAIDISDSIMSVDTGGIGWDYSLFNGFLLTILSGPSILSASYTGGTMAVTGLQLDSGNLWLDFSGQTGGIAYFSLETRAVPEPSTIALIGLGLVGLGFINRRRRNI